MHEVRSRTSVAREEMPKCRPWEARRGWTRRVVVLVRKREARVDR